MLQDIDAFVGTFGFTGPVVSERFNKSITGTKVTNELLEEKREQLEAQEDAAAQLARLRELKLLVLIAAFIWGVAHAENMEKYREAWAEEVKKVTDPKEVSAPATRAAATAATTSSYSIPVTPLSREELRERIQDVEKRKDESKKRYEEHEKKLEEADAIADDIVNREDINQDGKVKLLEEKIDEIQSSVDEDMQSLDDHLTRDWARDDAAQYEATTQRLNSITGKHLQMAELQQVVEVTKGEKTFYDKDGKALTSSHDAEYLVPKDQKLVKDQDRMYLLSQDKDLKDLPEAHRDEAHKAFLSEEPKLLTVKAKLRRDHEQDMKRLDTEKAGYDAQLQSIEKANQPADPSASSANAPNPAAGSAPPSSTAVGSAPSSSAAAELASSNPNADLKRLQPLTESTPPPSSQLAAPASSHHHDIPAPAGSAGVVSLQPVKEVEKAAEAPTQSHSSKA